MVELIAAKSEKTIKLLCNYSKNTYLKLRVALEFQNSNKEIKNIESPYSRAIFIAHQNKNLE